MLHLRIRLVAQDAPDVKRIIKIGNEKNSKKEIGYEVWENPIFIAYVTYDLMNS